MLAFFSLVVAKEAMNLGFRFDVVLWIYGEGGGEGGGAIRNVNRFN